jgi:hypothetical protein
VAGGAYVSESVSDADFPAVAADDDMSEHDTHWFQIFILVFCMPDKFRRKRMHRKIAASSSPDPASSDRKISGA